MAIQIVASGVTALAGAAAAASTGYYGNWGGLYWSGGEFTSKEPNWNIGGIDPLDITFREHDRDYWNAQQALKNGEISGAEYRRRESEADRRLLEKMRGLDPSTLKPGGSAMRERAIGYFEYKKTDLSWNGVKKNDAFDRAKNWTWPRDPIILDLDGNGLETVGLASNIHFDHDGDGVLTKTGWAGKDDALLVWDRNANGSIDSGAELFGDFTMLPNGTLAPNGYAALAALDLNGDGVIDANDPAFAELKLWRDASQDGVSQGGEFITLAEAGITSLNLAHTLKNQRLANGNTLARAGSFTRADGSESAMGEFHLAIDTFDTKFADEIEVSEPIKTLPTMGGSGNVRELQQAAAQSAGVAGLLAQFQSAATRGEQQALLDGLLTAWAGTSGMAKSLEERASGKSRRWRDGDGCANGAWRMAA